MTDRATINDAIQIGKESTAARGTAVAASRLLQALNINLSPVLTSREVRPRGNKLPTRMVPGIRNSAGGIESSAAVFGEICYPNESVFGVATPELVATTTAVYKRTYAMNPRSPDTYQSYTIERGNATAAERAAFGVFTGVTMEFTPAEINVTGDLVARPLVKGVTLTPDPTTLPMETMDPTQVVIYVDDTFATIGTTPLLRLLSGNFTVGDKMTPLNVINRLNAHKSFASLLEQAVMATLGLVVVANSQSDELLTYYEDADTVYVRVEVLGSDIEPTFPHLFQADMACSVESLDEGDQDGAWAATWGFRLVDDADVPGIEILIRNGVAVL